MNTTSNYQPPASREELLYRYAQGERLFPNTDLSESDLSNVQLDGASFEKHSWFFNTNFRGASLRNTSFRECNVKCADFSKADLTGASFELAAIESIQLDGANMQEVKCVGATFYGYTLSEGEQLPV